MKNSYLFLIAFMIGFAGCKKDDNSDLQSGLLYTYFPVNVGHETVYNVSLITKDAFSGVEDTVYYQLREVITAEFTDNQGRPTQRVERYQRPTSNDSWVISDVWTSNLTAVRAERKEENTSYVKLIFPVASNATWNGNSLNNLGKQDYTFTEVNQPMNLGGNSFDSTLTVLQQDEDLYTTRDYNVETYATGVGLIYRENIHIDKDYINPNNPGVLGQRLYKQTLVSWSN